MRKTIFLFISVVVLLFLLYFTSFTDITPEHFPPSLDGELVPIEVNQTGDYILYELKNITVFISSQSDKKYENIRLYGDSGNLTIYNVFVISNKTYFNTSWNYIDRNSNDLIDDGDNFVLFNRSKYVNSSSDPWICFSVKYYGGTIDGSLK